MHIINGNINHLKLLHLNKSNSNILMKKILLQNLIDCHEPHCISLVESNTDIHKPEELNPFEGYNSEHKILKLNGVETSKSQTMLLIKENLKYTRLYDLENDLNSLIIIKIELKNCAPVIIISGYRQWRLPEKKI